LDTLRRLKKLGIVILGGSIVKFVDGMPTYGFESWDCLRIQGESFKDYAKRSIIESKKYIESFKDSGNIGYVLEPITESDSLRLKEFIKNRDPNDKSLKYF